MILLPAYMLTHDLWALNHKVTFDGVNKLAIINHDVTTLDVAVELYSDWKEWVGSLETYRDFSKYEPAIRTIGGDPTVAGDAAGDIYFMTNGWRIYTDHSVVLTGDLFSDEQYVVADENFGLKNSDIDSVRITRVTADSSYRIFGR